MKFKIQYLFVNNFFNLLQLKTFYWIFPASIQNVCKKFINWNLDSKLEKNVLKIEEVKLVLDSRYFKTNWCIFLNCSLPYKCFKSIIRNKKWRKEWQNLLHIEQTKEPRSDRASHRSDTLKEKEKAPKDIEKIIFWKTKSKTIFVFLSLTYSLNWMYSDTLTWLYFGCVFTKSDTNSLMK